MTDSNTPSIAIITGSSRPNRIGHHVAALVAEALDGISKSSNVTLSNIDIATFSLPVFDEPVHPAMVPTYAQFTHAHSLAWSSEIAKHSGYILVTPSYNQGPPGGVKNAIDYLWNDIKGKPWCIVSYGIGDGGKAASDSLKLSLSCAAVVVETRPMLAFNGEGKNEMGIAKDVQLAAGGQLGEASQKDWEGKKGEFVKGFEEVVEAVRKNASGKKE
ncbi:flavoprotein-like protein [Amylocarpus encephaloides]|uniref:Flavoprotein-like protein n=1 Tax=Amylocarpus encephaloides TaxID=45428 RepID=A0A9P7YLD2_9HELO|nr:flavoprotein-like protein [Amylocarpus encephaloides]